VKYGAIIFDLDGTLIDSRIDLAGAVNHVRQQRQLPVLAVSEVAACVGDGLTKLLQRTLPDHLQELDQLRIEFFDYYGAHLTDSTTLYPGVRETLAHLGDRKLAVLTNKPHELAQAILVALEVDHFFGAIYGGGALSALKPDPAGVFAIAAQLGIALTDLLLVGDHVTDLETASRAGIDVCFCAFGMGRQDHYLPTYVINSFPELLAIV